MPRRIIPPGGTDDRRLPQTRRQPPSDPEVPRPDVDRETGRMSLDPYRADAILEGQPGEIVEATFDPGLESVVPGGAPAVAGVTSITYSALVTGDLTFAVGDGSTIVQVGRLFTWSLDEAGIQWGDITWNNFFTSYYTNIAWSTFWTETNWTNFFTNFYSNIVWATFFTNFYANVNWTDFFAAVTDGIIPIAKLVKGAECTVLHSTATGVEWAAGLGLPAGTALGQILVTGTAEESWAWETLAAPADDYPRQLEWQSGTGIAWQRQYHLPDPTGNAYQLAQVNVGGTAWVAFPSPGDGQLIVGLVGGVWTTFDPANNEGYFKWDGVDTWAIVGPIPVTDIAPAGAGTFTLKSVNGTVQWVEDP